MGELEVKVAIVTSSGQGLGKEIAIRLSEERVKVMVADFNPKTAKETASAIKEMGFVSSSFQVDITKSLEVEKMVEETLKKFD